MVKHRLVVLLLLLPLMTLLSQCASTPAVPEWVTQSARTVDNGYIVYVGTGEDKLLERARFKAEGEAIGDLVNECSFAPKGARIEDHFEQTNEKHEIKAFAKIGISFEECEQAKKTVDPTEIKNLASLPMAEELKRYQDLVGTEPEPQEQVAKAGGPGGTVVIHDTGEFYVVRQQVAWQKQYVILAPPGAYAPGTPAYVHYNTVVTQAQPRIFQYEQVNPSVRAAPTAWSHFQRTMPPPPRPPEMRQQMNRPPSPPPQTGPRRKRHRRRY